MSEGKTPMELPAYPLDEALWVGLMKGLISDVESEMAPPRPSGREGVRLIVLTVINGLAMIVNFEIAHRIVVLIMMEAKEKIEMEMKETMEKQRCGDQSA